MSGWNRYATALTAVAMIGGVHTSACSSGSSSRDNSLPSASNGSTATDSGSGGSGGIMIQVDGGTDASTTGIAAGGTATLPPGTDPVALIPARIRRLTNAEYNASVSALLGTDQAPADSFPPDARQDGFTLNDAQRVDSVLAKQLYAAAETLAVAARPNFATLAPCNAGDDPETCAQAFISDFGAKVYRRPLIAEEAAGLLDVYRAGADGATYEDGIELTLRALLQSAGFLYHTELGNGASADGTVALTAYELASSLSYLFTESPPSQELVDAALAGQLNTPDGRLEEVEILSNSGNRARDRFVRIIREWLELDRIDETAKDTNIYPTYPDYQASISNESRDFVARVLSEKDGQVNSLEALLTADYTVGDDKLAEYYASSGAGPYDGTLATPRRGILNQGAFLSVQAHAQESSPVLRGVLIARRVACLDIPAPASLNVQMVPVVADPSLTTRERFSAHLADPMCAQCHQSIDTFGNAFEEFDGMGTYRDQENGLPVDSSTTIALGTDFDGTYADSTELVQALAASPTVQECFARHAFRAAVGRSGETMQASEDYFIQQWNAVTGDLRGNLKQILKTYVESALFTHRRAP